MFDETFPASKLLATLVLLNFVNSFPIDAIPPSKTPAPNICAAISFAITVDSPSNTPMSNPIFSGAFKSLLS